MENNTINTKIADMSGNPFVCVHQTQSIFDEFDDEHMGSGNFGPGHYFCIEANYWDGFGVGGLENKNCYLIMQNPYDNSKKVSMKDVIKLAKMEDYVKELQANGGRINLNYKDTLRRVIDELFFTNLSYVVGLGINTNDDEMFAWKDQVWGKVVDGLKQQGYDGLVEKTPLSKGVIVVAWDSNSICQVPEKPKVTESNFKSYTQMKDVIGKAIFEMKKHYNEQISESIAPKLNDNFWKWFGNSKMKNKKGEPISFYHTTYSDISVFEPVVYNKGKFTPSDKGVDHFHFSKYKEWTDNFAKDEFSRSGYKNRKTYEVYLKIENPLVILPIERTINDWVKYLNSKGINISLEELLHMSTFGNDFDNVKNYRLPKGLKKEEKDKWLKNAIEQEKQWYASKKCQFWKVIRNSNKVLSSYCKEAGFDGILMRDTNRNNAKNLTVIVFDSNQIKSINNNGNWSEDSNNINEEKGLNESIAYAEMNDDDMVVILHNPTRKELKDNNLDDECRLVYDGNNGYYFASSEWTHEQIEQKLQAKNLPYAETSGEFYYYQDNLFTTRDDWSSEEEYQEYKNDWYQSLKSMPYIVKNFGNFKVEIFKGEYLSEEYEGLNRIAGFYWFDRHNWLEDGHFQLLKRKPIGVEELDPEDNDFDYYHLDDNGLEEDNKARFGIEKMGKKIVCYIESISKNHCLKAKKAIQRKFNNILIDKFQLSWGRDGFEELNESIVHAERSDDYYDDSEYQDMTNVILKNPSRKELEECGMIECRIAQDWDGNFYFANSYDMIHTDIVEKLESENIKSVETNLFYDTNSNTFYYNVGHLTDGEIEKFSEREEKYLRHSSYISKTFKDFHFKITFGEI